MISNYCNLLSMYAYSWLWTALKPPVENLDAYHIKLYMILHLSLHGNETNVILESCMFPQVKEVVYNTIHWQLHFQQDSPKVCHFDRIGTWLPQIILRFSIFATAINVALAVVINCLNCFDRKTRCDKLSRAHLYISSFNRYARFQIQIQILIQIEIQTTFIAS